MHVYGNLSKKSGVASFEIAPDAIMVRFKNGWQYFYTYRSAGRQYVETLKRLALEGRGLNGFIDSHADKKNYQRKW